MKYNRAIRQRSILWTKIKETLFPVLLFWSLFLSNAPVGMGQCNPSGNVSRYEFDIDPTVMLNLVGQQFCTSQSMGSNCCGNQSSYRCIDIVFNLTNGPNGETFGSGCNGTANFMTEQGNFDALFFNIGVPNPAGNATNCASPIGIGNNHTISATFTGDNMGQITVHLVVTDQMGNIEFDNSQVAVAGQSVIFTICKPGFGCVQDELVFGCCSISGALSVATNAPSTICNGGSTTLKIKGIGGTAPYTAMLGATNSGGTSFFSVTINDDMDGDPTMDMTTLAVTPSENTTYKLVSVEDATGCVQPVGQTVNITVNPVPQVDAVMNQTHCAGDAVPATVFTSSVPGAVFSWSRTVPNPDIGLGANSGTGNVPAFTATNTSNGPITSTFSVVASYTNNGVTCTGSPIQFTITVNPTPQVNAVANQTHCAGAAVPATVFSSSVPGAVFSWSRTVPNPDIGLGVNSGTGNVPAFTATNTSNGPITATFSVVASYSNNGVTCTGAPIQFTITINPNPQVNAVANQTHCAGAAVPATVFSSNVPGATFSWSRTVPNPDIGLGVNSGTGNVPAFTATNTSNAPITSTFSVVASYTNNGVTCTGAPIQFTITINPNPSVNAVANQTHCAGAAVPATVFSSNVPGVTFSWSRTVPNPDIGLGVNSGTGNVPAFTATNTSNAPITSTFSVVASYTNNGVTCTGAPIQFTITIKPTPDAMASPASQTICSGSNITPIVLSSSLPGTVLDWTRDNTFNVTGIPASGSGNISGSLTNTTNAPITVTFTISPTLNGCGGNPVSATVLVNPKPALFTLNGGGLVCTTDNIGVPVGLSGSQLNVNYQLQLNGNPVGAPVAGTGAAISFGLQLGIGNYTVVATHTQGGCTSIMTGIATIATFNCSVIISNPCICLNNATTLDNGQFGETIKVNAPGSQTWKISAVNGLYSINSPFPPALPIPLVPGDPLVNIGGNMFTLDGRHVDALGYTVTLSNSKGTFLTIGNSCQYPNPAFTVDLNGPFCLYSDPVVLTGNPGDANIVSQGFTVNGVPATQFDPGQGVGQYEIAYTVNGGVPKAFGPNDPGCTQTVKTTVQVVATPSNLVCDDQVLVALGPDCTAEVTPDDILQGNYLCFDDYLAEIDKVFPFGNGPWVPAVLNANDIGKTYHIRITHLVSGNMCWGDIKIEDNLPPEMVCENISVPCNTPDFSPAYLQNELNIDAAYPSVSDCQSFMLTWTDVEMAQNCTSGLTKIITRTWRAVDASGNVSTCKQIISVIRPTFADVVLPPNYDDIDEPGFQCGIGYPTPEWIENQGLQGFPHVFGQPSGCNINWNYQDVVIDVCDGTYRIVRNWTLIDFCTGTSLLHTQTINVSDEEGPNLICPADMTVSVDPYACCATVNLPDIIIEDNCSRINNLSGTVLIHDAFTGAVIGLEPIGGTLQDFPNNNWWDLDTLASFGSTPCLPLGDHTVTYIAQDACGNTSSCTFTLSVRDFAPPLAACDETTIVAIGVDDPADCYTAADGCEAAGVTWVKAKTFDDGSYDNCNHVKFTIRRMAPYSDCINQLSHDPCYQVPNGNAPLSEYDLATLELDSIKFYCCEVGTTQTVILRVTQIDANGQIMYGPDGEPLSNECMIQVEVQDHMKPTCLPPPQAMVNCENFDPTLWTYGLAKVGDNCCLDTSKVYQGQCGLTHSANFALFDTVCNKGTITRTFKVFDCHGLSSQCTQRVVVSYDQDYFVKFPDDVVVTACDGSGNFGAPVIFGEDCELLGVSFEDQIFAVVPDACYKIERSWNIINWCTYDPNLGCIQVPNPNPNPNGSAAANLPGPTVSAPGTLPPWKSTIVKIDPSDPAPTDFSLFWNKNANCYKYKQIIKITDGQAPTGTYTVPDCSNQNWFSANNNQLWNESYWWDTPHQSNDLCEETVDLCITATDACSGSNVTIRYLLFLDLDGDGSMETVVNSVNTGIAGLGWNKVLFNNVNSPNFSGGVARAFDERPVSANQKYGFCMEESVIGNNKTACVRWNTQQLQNSFVLPELPHGTHKIKWFITDGCGNNKEYEYTFTVKDCKAPTVVCHNGLSVNIMPTGMISLSASDFLQFTTDNCTPASQLQIGIRKCGTGLGFPLNANGQPNTTVNFDCTELGTQCVEVWAMDLAGNADYCETYVIVQDNLNNCSPGNTLQVAGALKTEMTDGVEEAMVNISGSVNFAPPFSYFDLSDATGVYQVPNGVPMASSFVIAPEKDDNPLNGVTTYDLVLISKHILGIEPLNSPYKMIAADANKSGSITTFDMLELRKLILGIYTELPNNNSWRFVDQSFVFPNPQNPFETAFPEMISAANALAPQLGEDFVGIKIGDVNNTAVANVQMPAEARSKGIALFDLSDQLVEAGEIFEVNFRTAEDLSGFQFTLLLHGLKVEGVPETDLVNASNFGIGFEDAVTVSINDAQEFTLRFRATEAGLLSQMLGVSGSITRAEAYRVVEDSGKTVEKLDIAFRFDHEVIARLGFELYQNQPNPFVNRTTIGFYLPEPAEAVLSVSDETGRLVYQQKGAFAQGANTILLDRALLNSTGVLYYKLETDQYRAVKKMIQTK